MRKKDRSPLVLVSNNPFGHHLLTSQLLNVYEGLDDGAEKILLCKGVMDGDRSNLGSTFKVISYAAKGNDAFSYLFLLLNLLKLRWKYPRAIYHLRGFVAGGSFFVSRLGFLRRTRYIYDPRGAFFLEWREAGGSKIISGIICLIESFLIQHSVVTIVTSSRFATLYRRVFGEGERYLIIYNTTGFEYRDPEETPRLEDKLRIVYLGTFNHWHDLDELARVMLSVASQFGMERTEISVFTLPKFHEAVRRKFGTLPGAKVNVGYVKYSDIPGALKDKHVGVSVVRPTLSSRIASPIKVSDYVALGLTPLLNEGIGDFDRYFRGESSAVLYKFGGGIDISGLEAIRKARSRTVYDLVSLSQAKLRLAAAVERMRNG